MSITDTGTRKNVANTRTRGRPFAAGNPGRPRGSRNRATRAVEALLDGEAEALTRKAVELALAGDVTCLRLCLDRIYPPRKARTVALDLAGIGEHDGATAVVADYQAIMHAVAAGELSPAEGLELIEIVERQRYAVAELAPARMGPKPKPLTPEQQAQKKAQDAKLAEMADMAGTLTGIPTTW
jgi:hypothetical protein